MRFVPKNLQKTGSSGVFRSAVEHFGILLCHSKDNQADKIANQLEEQGVETKKRQHYGEENSVLRRKVSKKGVILGFSGVH